MFPKFENILSMDADEAVNDSSWTANATKSLGNPYDLRAFHQLTEEIFVAASVKYVEGNVDACAW